MDKKNQEQKSASKQKKTTKKVLSRVRFGESYVSLFLGILVVFIGIFLLIMFTKPKRTQEVSSIKTEELQQILGKTENKEQQKYTVVVGDTLWRISEKKYKSGYDWREIAKANNITDPTAIKIGDVLVIPEFEQKMSSPVDDVKASSSAVVIQPTPAVTDTQKIVQDSYTVIIGDSLWDIAVRSYGDGFRWVDIAKANNIDDPDLIFPGNIFKIPR